MKIGPYDEIVKPVGVEPAKHKRTETGNFNDLLSEAMDKTQPTGPQAPGSPTAGIVGGIGVNPLSPNPKVSLINRVDDFLNTLDSYCRMLGDQRFSLKDMHPLVEKIESDKEGLMTDVSVLSKNDGLKDILDQTLITASLEMIRFNRGDYIAA